MGNFIQKVFDLYTNNYRTYTEKLINAETPKIFFFDPNVTIQKNTISTSTNRNPGIQMPQEHILTPS